MKGVALGQYYEGNSLIHRLDPRVKLFSALCLIVGLFAAKSLWCFLLLGGVTLLLVAVSRVSFRVILRGLRPLIAVLIFTSLISLFLTRGQGEPLFSVSVFGWFSITLYWEGILRAVFLAVRILLLVMATSLLLTYTTTPTTLTDALERVLHPLTWLRVPVYDFAMMMTIALRFIPTLVEETDRIMCAQKARGADFSSGSLLRRARALIPILIPLFVSSFRRAGELATAMECRCYRGGAGRTRLRVMRLRASDYVFLILSAICLALVFLGNAYLPTACTLGGAMA